MLALAHACAPPCAQGSQHDVVIRNGLIYYGSGEPPQPGDVAIDGDRIVD